MLSMTCCLQRAFFLTAVLALPALPALAQPSPAAPTVSAAQADLADTPSVFANYQAYAEQAVTAWPQANALVAQIGGWRVYAQQAQQADVAPPDAVPTLRNPTRSTP